MIGTNPFDDQPESDETGAAEVLALLDEKLAEMRQSRSKAAQVLDAIDTQINIAETFRNLIVEAEAQRMVSDQVFDDIAKDR